jgi:hypothetical protein
VILLSSWYAGTAVVVVVIAERNVLEARVTEGGEVVQRGQVLSERDLYWRKHMELPERNPYGMAL